MKHLMRDRRRNRRVAAALVSGGIRHAWLPSTRRLLGAWQLWGWIDKSTDGYVVTPLGERPLKFLSTMTTTPPIGAL